MLPKKILTEMKKYPPFYQKVWKICAQIPKGKTLTYACLAKKAGSPKAARAVGQAMKKNPFAPHVPCHRVVATNGIGGFSGFGGVKGKIKLLKKEGVTTSCLQCHREKA
ncbi:MAG TPA: MGMT family protein [Elusimicrobiales bacterium]|nr:MGMT family protein [Elusimicrobiales bacterium]